MSLRVLFEGLAEVRSALAADLDGRLLDGGDAPGSAAASGGAAAAAAALSQIAAAGGALRMADLQGLTIRGAATASLATVRSNAFLMVEVDPAARTGAVEKALSSWSPPPKGKPARAESAASLPEPLPEQVPPSAPSQPAQMAPPDDAWAALRRALARGHLTEAAALQAKLGAAPQARDRAGAEPMAGPDRARALQILLDGIGCVLAGDAVGGGNALRELAGPSQPNLSFRWLALHWSARAALNGDALLPARQHVKDALDVARLLDLEARAVSQWIAAELLARGGDNARALAWLGESRTRFERLGDRWGQAQTWLAEAKVLAANDRDAECAEAARRAWATDAEWDGPPIFLATRALIAGDLAEAEGILQVVKTPAATRLRTLIEAMREGVINQADAAEFLREHHAPPSQRAIRALFRIATTSPRFPQAREALAWMLLKVGKYAEAGSIFRALLTQPLSPEDRASAVMGLGCIANAAKAGAQVDPGGAPAPAEPIDLTAQAEAEVVPLARLSESALTPRKGGSGGAAPTNVVFSGRLSVFSMPDLVEFLRSARRTGLLVCSAASGMGALRFREGWIVGASAPGVPSLGEMLLRARKVTTLALRAAEATPAGPGQADGGLAEALVREGLVDADSVLEALQQQVELAVRELVRWKDGEFAFNHEAVGPQPPGTPMQVDAQTLLLTLFKEMDEASRSAAASEV